MQQVNKALKTLFRRPLIPTLVFGLVVFATSVSAGPIKETIVQREQDILARAASISSTSHSTLGERSLINQIFDRFKMGTNPTDEDKILIKNWAEEVRQFHQSRFQVIRQKHDYFLSYVYHKAIEALQKRNFTDEQIRERLAGVDREYRLWKRYANTLSFESTQKERSVRIWAFLHFFEEVSKALTRVGHSVTHPNADAGSKRAFVRECFGLLAPSFWTDEQPTPTTARIVHFFRTWAEYAEIQVRIEGREALESLSSLKKSWDGNPNREINIFTPSHRSAPVDQMVMAQYAPSSFLLFANPAADIPAALLSYLAVQPDFIGIGPSKDKANPNPVEKTLSSLSRGFTSNIVNYPQALIADAGAVLPPHRDFTAKLVLPLLERGYKVNIIPVTHEIDSSCLRTTNHQNAVYTAKVLPVIPHQAIGYLARHSDDLAGVLELYLLTIWYESTTQYKELTLDELLKRAEGYFGFQFDENWEEQSRLPCDLFPTIKYDAQNI